MQKWIIGAVVLVVVVGGVWLGTRQKQATGNPIKLGASISLTGVASAFGEMSKDGIELAVKEINANGGVDGRPVEVVIEDDQTDGAKAVGVYQKLTSVDHVDAIVGTNFDFVAKALFDVAKGGNTVIATPSTPRVGSYYGENGNAFFMMANLDEIVDNFRSYLATQTYHQIAIVRFESAFGEVFAGQLSKIATDSGHPAIINETYKQFGLSDFRTTILRLKNAGADLVFLDMIGSDPVTFVTQANQLGFHPHYLTHNGLNTTLAIRGVDPNLFNGIVDLDWNVSTPQFVEAFTKAYGIAPTNSANRAYEAVYVLADAVAHAQSRVGIPDYIARTTFKTPYSTVSFAPDHSAAHTAIVLLQMKDGKLVPLPQ